MGRTAIRVLLVDDGKEWRGGQRQTFLLARGLLKRNHSVMIACLPESELAKESKRERIPIWEIPMRGEWDAMAAWRLGNLANDVDILHAQTAHAHTLVLLAVRIGTWKPVVVHRRVDFQVNTGLFARWKYRGADRFIAISQAVATLLKEAGVPPKKISVVHSGVDPKPIADAVQKDLRAELNLPASAPIIGTVGQLVDHKGHCFLVDAVPEIAKLVPGVQIVIVGDGELESQLKHQARQLNVGNQVHFLGYRRDVPSIIKSFNVFVMPSHLEGLGTSLLDAIAAGVPLAAAAAGGIPEIITDGIEGVLFAPKNPAALAKSVSELLMNPIRAKIIAEAAQKKLKKYFTDDVMVDGVIKVYKEIVPQG